MKLDIVTFNKLFNFFNYREVCFVDDVLKDAELDELKKLDIIRECSDGQYTLKRKSLYNYAKIMRNNREYDISILILNYLLGYQDKFRKNWFFTYNYQLFKVYFLKGDYHNAYRSLKIGFDNTSAIYPVLVNLLNYILMKPKENFSLGEEIYNYVKNNDFDNIIKYYEKRNDGITSAHQKAFNMVIEKAKSINLDINNDIMDYINKKDFKGLVSYTEEISIKKQSNDMIYLIHNLASTAVYINVQKEANKDDILQLIKMLNDYRSDNVDFGKKYSISSEYADIFDKLLNQLYYIVINSDYNKYLKSRINRVLNKIKREKQLLIIDDLSDIYNVLVYEEAVLDDKLKIDVINGKEKRIVVKANISGNYRNVTIDTIKELYANNNIKECLDNCIKYINDNMADDIKAYYYAGLCYKYYANKEQASKFLELSRILSDTTTLMNIKTDAKFYGINSIFDLISFANKYNVSIDLACIHYGLNVDETNRVKLLMAKYLYASNNHQLANLYYNSALDDESSAVNKLLISEIDDHNKYQDIDYLNAKDFAQKLVLKK